MLVTEGTYPCAYGGVSVWCDQLVQGMPEHTFRVRAITGTGGEPVVWELPGNVEFSYIPLWGPAPRERRPAGPAMRRFRAIYRALIEAILALPDSQAADGQPPVRFLRRIRDFTAILRELHEFSLAHDLTAAMRSEQAVAWLLDAWSARAAGSMATVSGLIRSWSGIPPGPAPAIRPTVHDALTAADFLEHSLRPLARPAEQASVSHAVANGSAVLVCLGAKWRHGTPFMLTEHGIYLRERYLEQRRSSAVSWPVKSVMLGYLRLLCSAAYAEADLVTPGNQYNQRWELRCGGDPARVRTVYNGVNPEHFHPARGEPEVPTISWAGRIDPIKDLETLIRAFALVHEAIPEARLRIFGGTPAGNEGYASRCRALAGELGTGDAVSFEGRVASIRSAYAAGHVVALSSISEGFPYTLIEAMTSGRATVSTRVGGVPEAVADTGLVVPPRDPEAMAQACLRLLRDDMLRHRLAAAARARALELFTVDRAVGSFRAIYAALAAGQDPFADEGAAVTEPPEGSTAVNG